MWWDRFWSRLFCARSRTPFVRGQEKVRKGANANYSSEGRGEIRCPFSPLAGTVAAAFAAPARWSAGEPQNQSLQRAGR
jgi:hypothetical protein